MKKLAIAAAAAASLTAGVANAYTVGTFSNGFVVPNVIHTADGSTTAVGLINQSGSDAAVYWTFFDENSKHITDGCFKMTNKDYESFIWSSQGGVGTAGMRGYLVFAVGSNTAGGTPQAACGGNAKLAAAETATTTGAAIAGNAFQVNVTGKTVSYTPVIDGALTLADPAADITTLNENSLVGVAGAVSINAANTTEQFSLRYAIDGNAGGTDTRIVVWSTGNHNNTHTVNMYDAAQNRKSVNFKLSNTEQDFFDPETIVGRPANFLDGFIEWPVTIDTFKNAPTTPAVTQASVVAYSIISVPSFGAEQTVLGSHR